MENRRKVRKLDDQSKSFSIIGNAQRVEKADIKKLLKKEHKNISRTELQRTPGDKEPERTQQKNINIKAHFYDLSEEKEDFKTFQREN